MDYKKQLEDALIASGGMKKAASRALGWPWSTFRLRLSKYPELTEKYCSNLVSDPIQHEADLINAANPSINGMSTYYDYTDEDTGERKRGWIKSKRQNDAIFTPDKIEALIKSLSREITKVDKISAPKLSDNKLVTQYPFFDMHVSMRSWPCETGQAWDIPISRQVASDAMHYLVNNTDDSSEAILLDGGDYFHTNGSKPLTPESGHLLDVDSRCFKMLDTGIDILRDSVTLLLKKHSTVRVIIIEGNHDPDMTVALRLSIAIAFENNPRVIVPKYLNPYFAHRHGSTMLAYHHGHLKKPPLLPRYFATHPDFAPIWGATKYRYGHSGHEHHYECFEKDGMIWTKHPTLCAKDSYASRYGFESHRAMIAHTYHSERGLTAFKQYMVD